MNTKPKPPKTMKLYDGATIEVVESVDNKAVLYPDWGTFSKTAIIQITGRGKVRLVIKPNKGDTETPTEVIVLSLQDRGEDINRDRFRISSTR